MSDEKRAAYLQAGTIHLLRVPLRALVALLRQRGSFGAEQDRNGARSGDEVRDERVQVVTVLLPVPVQEAHVDVADRVADHGNGARMGLHSLEYLREPFMMAEKHPSLPNAW